MNNFQFYNPVHIEFGKGQISKLSKLVPANAKILMTYGGGSIKRNGVYDQVKEALSGHTLIEFSGIEPNPKYETLMKAVEIIRNEKIDFLLAVGGGSVIDGTKFISAAVNYEGDPWQILAHRDVSGIKDPLPIGAVLTLPATGSEMNGNSVVTKAETKEKLAFGTPAVMPKFSILDPEVIYSLPKKQISNGIIDAFIHVLEQYLTYPVNSPIQDRFAESILATLVEEGPKVYAEPTNYDAAANFMWAATMALNGLIGVGVPQDWSTHMIGHELTAFHGIDHGRTLAIVLPGVMRVKQENKREKLLQYGERIWNITEGTFEERLELIIAKTEAFFHSLETPTRLSDYEVPASTIDKICDRFEQRRITAFGEQGDTDIQQLRMILEDRL
ncbi:iron-containing alcohol dehydrogenase [Prolixibacteraceae bacterium JC049]|nr:iron-containing alcohol dehydrogenase [Prolixibacteraceae bacterium JC049]